MAKLSKNKKGHNQFYDDNLERFEYDIKENKNVFPRKIYERS